MTNSIETGTCDMCKTENVLVQRKYYHYGIKCDCHSPEHFEIIRHCSECEPKPPTKTTITISPNTERVLRLPIEKTWYDMILSGEKTEEYRIIKSHWIQRLCENHPKSVISGGDLIDRHTGENYTIKEFDSIIFTNGYGKHRPSFKIECKGITIGQGKPGWGALPNTDYFIIKLGKQL